MSKQITLQARVRVVAEKLEQGASTADITAECAALWNTSERTVERYIALAKDMVLERMNDMDAIIEAVRGAVVAEEAEKHMRSNLELEARLIEIIEGELEVEKVVSGPKGVTEVKSKPTRREIMQAISILWKRRGLLRSPALQNRMENKPAMPLIRVSSEEEKRLLEDTTKLP